MFPLDTGKAGLKKIDYDILSFIEYPKSIEEIKVMFPAINVTVKILELMDKGLVEEKMGKYISKFYTEETKRIIEDSKVPKEVKRSFGFFLSQIDNPFVRDNILDSEIREKTTLAFSLITKSIDQELTQSEIFTLKGIMESLMNKLS